ncbi:MAG: MarR family transcriptional regulator [Gemmatimonadaceae bacterium]|nr:MarR family transcriptional regulator [Gemmatimonadaceae bacterium]
MTIRRPRAESTPIQSHQSESSSGAHALKATPEQAAALRLWVIMSRAHSAIAEHAAADIARHGLTLAEFAILEALYHGGPMLLGEVQRRILVSSGGITFLVDRLTAKGLVERRNCPTDRRARYASLTQRGDELTAAIFEEHAETLTQAMSGLSTQEQVHAADLLRTLGLSAASLPKPVVRPESKAASA